MIKDILGLTIWLVGGFLSLQFSSSISVDGLILIPMATAALLLDMWLLTKHGQQQSRVSPIIGLALAWSGPQAFVAASAALFLGSLLISTESKSKRGRWGDLARSIAPIGAASVIFLKLPWELPHLTASLVFVVVSLLLEARRYALRPSLVVLLATPGMALATTWLAQNRPWYLPLLIPVYFGLASGTDDNFPILKKLRTALSLSRQQTRLEADKARRFQNLLKAANQLASTLDPEALGKALSEAATAAGAKKVRVYPPGGQQAVSKSGIALVGGKGFLCFEEPVDSSTRDQLEILGRIFSTCWENSRLHNQVIQALEQTKRSQAQLVESSRLAATGMVAAGVAHEVNTPLGAIRLATELAVRFASKDPEETVQQLQSIERATERAHKAVERVLYYARSAEGEITTFEVSKVVEDAVALLSYRVSRAKCKVLVEVPDGLKLRGDRQELYTLLFNLLLNGVEAATGSSPAQVAIRARSHDGQIEIQVKDSGPGVPEAIKERIFEAFFTTRPHGEGTGLGLHLAAQAAQSFGGKLKLLSNPGGGAIFSAIFPAASALSEH